MTELMILSIVLVLLSLIDQLINKILSKVAKFKATSRKKRMRIVKEMERISLDCHSAFKGSWRSNCGAELIAKCIDFVKVQH